MKTLHVERVTTLALICALCALCGGPALGEVNSTVDCVSYNGNGSTKTFTVPFGIFSPSTLRVVLRTTATGAEDVQVLNSDFTATDNDSDGDWWDGTPGGSITFKTAPAAGVEVWISRLPQLTQTSDIDGSTYVRLSTIEDAVDKIVTQIQYLRGLSWRSLTAQETDRQVVDMNLPDGWSLSAGYPYWDGDSWGMSSTDLPDTAASAYWGNVLTQTTLSGSLTAMGGASAIRPLLAVGVINVTDAPYNATGDGVTDDTTAIQAAFTAAAGNTVFFPAGTYLVSDQLATGLMRVKGSGYASTILKVAATFTGDLFAPTAYSEFGDLRIEGQSQSHVFDAIVGATGDNPNCRIYRMRFKYVGGVCIQMDASWGTDIVDVHCLDVGYGLRLEKFNGGTIRQFYVNGHHDHAVVLSDSRACTIHGLILENSDDPGAVHRLYLSGVEGATIDGFYTEGTLGTGGRDIYMSQKSGIGSCEGVLIRNAWMNSNSITGVAPIYAAYVRNCRFEDIHWHTPSNTYWGSPDYYIENETGAAAEQTIYCRGWSNEDGSEDIALAKHNDFIMYDVTCGLTGDAETAFLTVADAAGHYPHLVGNNRQLAAVSHDYAAGTTAWNLTSIEAFASLLTVTNASGAADAVFAKAIPGKMFWVYNNSGQAITFKVSGQAGVAVANGKRAILGMDATDVRELYEQP